MTDTKSRRDAVAILLLSYVHAERDETLTAAQLQQANKVLHRAAKHIIHQGATCQSITNAQNATVQS